MADFIGVSNPIPGTVRRFDAATRRASIESDRGLQLEGHITDPTANPAPNDAVVVAIRPERLTVEPTTSNGTPSRPGRAAAGWTSVPGRITQGTYLGEQTEFRINTDLAGELIVRRQNVTGASGGSGLGPGDPVVVRWHEDANLVLVG